MSTPVNLPALGESVTEGTITRWLKSVGDTVEVDEALLEISTDKVDTEIPSPVAGTLLEIKAEEDETVEVGAELCVIGDEDEGGGSDSEDSGDSEGTGDSEGSGEDDSSSETDSSAEEDSDAESDDEESEADSEDDAEEMATEDDSAQAESSGSGGGGSGGGSSGGGGGTPVTLPALGESVTEGTITQWLKSVGDTVEVDEALLEISTDKVDTEIPSPVAGTLLEIKAEEDETVEVGAELCIIGDESADSGSADAGAADDPESTEDESEPEPEEEPAPEADEDADSEDAEPDTSSEESSKESEASSKPEAKQSDAPAPKDSEGTDGGDGGSYVTPLVRKMAAKHGVELGSLKGTGVGGRIRKQDVLAAAEQAKKPAEPAASEEKPAAAAAPAASGGDSSPLRGRTEPMSRLRKVIASRMVESLQVSAQLTTVVEVDVTAIGRLRDSVKEEFAAREGVGLSFMAFFAKAAIDALKTHPSLNAAIDTEKGEVTYHDHENLSVAVDTEKGLLTPVIKDAGDLSVSGLAKKIADLAERTRASKIGPDELSGGTFTLTNTGSRGALFDTPILNQPQVAILGTGLVVKRPVVIDDANLGETIAIRQMCYLALTYDHRLVDGADAARFLSDVKARLEAAQFEV